VDLSSGLAIASGALIGFVLGTTGGGGSLLAIPLLVYGLGIEARAAAAMSLVVVAGAALVGVYQRRASGMIKVRAAVVFSGVGSIGAWVGAFGHRFVRSETVLLLFGVLMLLAVWLMWRLDVELPEAAPQESCADRFPRSCWAKVVTVGLLAGLLSGFFGVGGGFIIVPALTVVLGFPIRTAVSTALLIIALISVGGLFGPLQAGPVDWPLTGLLLLGGVFGMSGGSWVAQRVPPAAITRSFTVIAIAVAVAILVHNGLKEFLRWSGS
jgi:uncharacterized membrane protein YfcA